MAKTKDPKNEFTRRDVARFGAAGAALSGLLGRLYGQQEYHERERTAKIPSVVLGGTGSGLHVTEVYHTAERDPFAAETDPIGCLKEASTNRRGMLGLSLIAAAGAFKLGFRSNRWI